jgi:hypothetical protein
VTTQDLKYRYYPAVKLQINVAHSKSTRLFELVLFELVLFKLVLFKLVLFKLVLFEARAWCPAPPCLIR